MMYYDIFATSAGQMIVVQDDHGLRHIDFQDGPVPLPIDPRWQRSTERCRDAREQLLAYFNGTLTRFDLPLAPAGTEFQKRVWQELAKIPFGEISTYGAMAKNLGKPSASRAVGMANGRNPLNIVLPCHRVVGSSRKLTGYRGGLDLKTQLLKHEGFTVKDGIIDA